MNVPFEWPEAAVSELRRLKALGWSSSQIADHLSADYRCLISRNAVIGKCKRMGIETMSKEAVSATIKATNARRATPPRKAAKERVDHEAIRQRRAADLIRAAQEREAAKAAEVIQIRPAAVHADSIAADPCCIDALTFSSCRWPLERTAPNGDTLFCANTKGATGPYCEGHAKRAYARTQTKEQKTAAAIERDRNKAAFRASGGRDSHVFGFSMAKRFA